MTKHKSYIKLVWISDSEYEIYAIDGDKKIKLSRQQKVIMKRVLKKLKRIKINENTYVYSNYNLITLKFRKEMLLAKRKKVNRSKSKKILPRAIPIAALALMIAFLITNCGKENEPLPTEPTLPEDTSITIETTYETMPIETIIPETTEYSKDIIDFEYEFDTPGDKASLINSMAYMELYSKYEKMYGIDANLLCAIGAQESSGMHHKESIDGGFSTGIMGISTIWTDAELTVFNFETNSYETIQIDYSKIGEVDYNIKIGAAIFQNYFYGTLDEVTSIPEEEFLAFSVQKYNMGPGNVYKILKIGPNWTDNRELIDSGDRLYFEHVLSRLDNDTVIKIKLIDGTFFETKITNKALENKHTKA